MVKKFITNKQKELIFSILPNISVEKIEKIIKLLLEKKIEEIKKELEKEKKELVDEIIKINPKELELKEYPQIQETQTKHFTKDGYKKTEVLEDKIAETEKITKTNFDKHPAHFKYVAYLLNQLDNNYDNSKLRLKLRKTFLGEDFEGKTTYHDVKMFQEYSGKKDLEKYLKEKPHLLRKDFTEDEQKEITNAIVGTLRDYYYRDFLGLKNYQDYIINNSDSTEVKRKKIKKLRFMDAAITSRQGEFGMSNEDIFKTLKHLQEKSLPFGGETILNQIDEHIFGPMIERHKQETKQKILNSFLTNKNYYQFQHFINDHLAKNPDIPETHKENIRKLYQDKNLDSAKSVFSQLIPKGMGNYNIAEKEQFETMRQMYSTHNNEYKQKYSNSKKPKSNKDKTYFLGTDK